MGLGLNLHSELSLLGCLSALHFICTILGIWCLGIFGRYLRFTKVHIAITLEKYIIQS